MPPTPRPPSRPAPDVLSDRDIDALQSLLDRIPAPLEPLDVSTLDGFLCGVLLQPQPVPEARWADYVTDSEARPLPAGFDAAPILALVRLRRAELDTAIGHRQWFDPWVFELSIEDSAPEGAQPGAVRFDAVVPWVAGFSLAQEVFPALMRLDATALKEPLTLLYRHLDADDLEDADDLIEEMESLEPPQDLGEAVEELVRATLLIADISRPVRPRPLASHRGSPRRR